MKAVTIDRVFSPPDGQQITFNEISSIPVMFYWLQNQFLDSVLQAGETWDNGNPITPFIDEYYVTHHNKLLGNIRFRLVRVKPGLCPVDSRYSSLISTCYAAYSTNNEEKTPYKNYVWTSDEQNEETWYWGKNDRYSGSGYVVNFPTNYSQALTTLQSLRDNLYVDRQARALFIDFNTYNPALNSHVAARIVFEFPETGGVRTRSDLSPLRLLRYRGDSGAGLITLEVILFLFILGFIVYESVRVYFSFHPTSAHANHPVLLCGQASQDEEDSQPAPKKEGESEVTNTFSYWRDPWNYLEWINIFIFVMVMIVRFYTIGWINSNGDRLTRGYVPLQLLVFLNDFERYSSGVNAFLLWFKMFKYLSFINRFKILFDIFSIAFVDLFFFLIIFLIFFIGMAQTGFLFFFQDVYDFRSFSISIVTLFKSLSGGLDSDALAESNRIFGPAFFVFFNVIVILVLINVFLAIVNESYDTVSSMHKNQDNSVGQMLRHSFEVAKFILLDAEDPALLEKMRQKKKIQDFVDAVLKGADVDHDGTVDREEFIQYMITQQHTSREYAENLFAKYDSNKDLQFDTEEMQGVIQELNEETQKPEVSTHQIQNEIASQVRAQVEEGMARLQKRVDEVVDQYNSQIEELKSVISSLKQKNAELGAKASASAPVAVVAPVVSPSDLVIENVSGGDASSSDS